MGEPGARGHTGRDAPAQADLGCPSLQAPRRNRVAGKHGLEKVLPLPRQRLSADVRTVQTAPPATRAGAVPPPAPRPPFWRSGGSAAGGSQPPRLGVRAGLSLGGRPRAAARGGEGRPVARTGPPGRPPASTGKRRIAPAEFCGLGRWPLPPRLPWDSAPSPQVCRSRPGGERQRCALPAVKKSTGCVWCRARWKMPFIPRRMALDGGSSWALVSAHFAAHPLVHLVFGIWETRSNRQMDDRGSSVSTLTHTHTPCMYPH